MGFGLRSTTATFVYMPHSAVVIRFEKALPLRTREKGGRRERPTPPPKKKQGGQAIREASPQALLHGLFSHAPSLDKQQVSKYSQHQAIGGRLRFWNRSFKASCSSPWTVFLSWAASTRSCW